MSCLIRSLPVLLVLLVTQGGAAVFGGDTTLEQRERFVLSEINRLRAEQGLSQLRLNSELCSIARSHSFNMAKYGYLSHRDSLGRDFGERLDSKIAAPYQAGENVGRNNFPDSARVVVEDWRQSPNHLKNILNKRFAETGIGVAVDSDGLVFFTQIFMGK